MIGMVGMKMGIVEMITDYEGNKKHEVLIGRVVTYDPQYIEVGLKAMLHWVNDEDEIRTCITTAVQNIHEDSYGMTLYTKNSIFYINKELTEVK
jgi:hypothetical protein